MLFEHEITMQLATKMKNSAHDYIQSGNADILLSDIKSYTDHVALHLSKENERLFMMADTLLQQNAEQVIRILPNQKRRN
jgi:hemerythrin-like domain-containing protein